MPLKNNEAKSLTPHLPVLLGIESTLSTKSWGMPHLLVDQVPDACLGGHRQLCRCYFYPCDVTCLLISRQRLVSLPVTFGIHRKLSRYNAEFQGHAQCSFICLLGQLDPPLLAPLQLTEAPSPAQDLHRKLSRDNAEF